MSFEQWFRKSSYSFEKLLFSAVIVFLLLLFAGQLLLQTVPQARQLLSMVDRLEGQPYLPRNDELPALSSQAADGAHYIVLKVAGKRKSNDVLEVLVNGQVKTSLNDTGTATISVQAGDHVEIDGVLPDSEIEVVVSAVSEGVIAPRAGKIIYFFGRPETVGWIDTVVP